MYVLVAFGIIMFSTGYFPRFLKPWVIGGLIAIMFFQIMSAFTDDGTGSIFATQNATSATVTTSGVGMNIPWELIKIGLLISIPFIIYMGYYNNRGSRI